MGECAVCKRSVNKLYDGMCADCLACQGAAEAQGEELAENDATGLMPSTGLTMSDIKRYVSSIKMKRPDLNDEETVATIAGYDTKSKLWKSEGKQIMKFVKLFAPRILRGEVEFGSSQRYMSMVKPGKSKRVIKVVGSACFWEWE